MLPSEADFSERHSIGIDAPAERVFAAVRGVTLAEMGVFRALARLRGLRMPADRPIVELALAGGWEELVAKPDELVLGAIGRPWRLRGDQRLERDFVHFEQPGYVKMTISWRLDGKRLVTETHVRATDAAARRAFRRYWLVIRPFSGLIRRVWLRAIRRRAGRG